MFYHLREAFCRFSYLMISFLGVFLISYMYSSQVLYVFVKNFLVLTGIFNLNYIGLFDIIIIYLKVVIIFSVSLTVPLLVYHLLTYFYSGCFLQEYHILSISVIGLCLMMVSYMLILWTFIIPLIFKLVIWYQDLYFAFVLKLKYEVFLNNYLLFIYYLFIYKLCVLGMAIIFLYIQLNVNKVYIHFILAILILLLSPPQLFFQLLLICSSFILWEIINFIMKCIILIVVCIKEV